jgi:MoxR-like ATPase
MLEIRLLEAQGRAQEDSLRDIFGPDFLIRRPLLQAIEHRDAVPPVLLIDELDRADAEFEAPISRSVFRNWAPFAPRRRRS